MNFLQLCQRVRAEAGISGSGPSSVTGQSGELQRVIDWVNMAWEDIQNAHHDWNFLRSSAAVVTVPTVAAYAPAQFTDTTTALPVSAHGSWITSTFTIHRQSIGVADQGELVFLPYDDFRRLYMIGPQVQRRPTMFTVAPNRSIVLGDAPDDTYVVSCDYFRAATPLLANGDVPAMPERFHALIVWRALMFYGEFEAAGEAYARGKNNFNRLMSRMEAAELPPVTLGPPLVE